MTKYWTEPTKYWVSTTDDSPSNSIPTSSDASPPATTADPNSLGELMRYAIFLPGNSFPYDPKMLVKTD